MALIEKIKARITIIELLSRLGLKPNSAGFIYSIYKTEKTPSLKIYPDTNSYYDFSTNTGGDVIKFYADYHDLSIKEAVGQLAELFNLSPHKQQGATTKRLERKPEQTIELLKDKAGNVFEEEKYFFDERAGVYEFEGELDRREAERRAYQDLIFYREDIRCNVLEKFYEFGSKNIPPDVENYLMNDRKLKVNTILDFKLFGIVPQRAEEYLRDTFDEYQLRASGLFTQKGYFVFKNHTVIIPYIEYNKIVFMKARSITGAKQKYIGLSGASAKRFYNSDMLKKVNEVMIVEGEFDCAIHIQETDNPTIAVGGVGNIPDLKVLKGKDVYILFDNDEAGRKASRELFEKVKALNITAHLLRIKTNAKDISELM